MTIPEILAIGMILILAFLAINEHRNKIITIKKINRGYLKDCKIINEIDFVERIDNDIFLARTINGKWGIGNKERWLHQGDSQYIMSKWRDCTNKNHYLPSK